MTINKATSSLTLTSIAIGNGVGNLTLQQGSLTTGVFTAIVSSARPSPPGRRPGHVVAIYGCQSR